MNNHSKITEFGIQVLEIESEAIQKLRPFINSHFAETVNLVLNCKGRVVFTGIGKSAIIANKIVATLNSTGTPAIFMHAADAIHGDLGMIQQEDLVICISKSGNTPEICALVPFLKNWGNKLIAMVGNLDSYLAKQADFVLNTTVEKEACPNNLAPTSSSTAQLVMGDALAVCLLKLRNFSSSDFAKYHPGGALGKQLYLKVQDIYVYNQKPMVQAHTAVKDVIMEISEKRLGTCAVLVNEDLLGVITDGDIRRMLEKHEDIRDIKAEDIMNRQPKTIDSSALAVDAMQQMKDANITQLLVLENGIYKGVIHLHDLLREGIA